MSNCNQVKNQNVENTNEEDFLKRMSSENRELFKRALSEALDLKFRDIEEQAKDIEIPPPSKRHKIRMNRLFRERVGGEFLPFSEEDNLYDKLVIKVKVNENMSYYVKIPGIEKGEDNTDLPISGC